MKDAVKTLRRHSRSPNPSSATVTEIPWRRRRFYADHRHPPKERSEPPQEYSSRSPNLEGWSDPQDHRQDTGRVATRKSERPNQRSQTRVWLPIRRPGIREDEAVSTELSSNEAVSAPFPRSRPLTRPSPWSRFLGSVESSSNEAASVESPPCRWERFALQRGRFYPFVGKVSSRPWGIDPLASSLTELNSESVPTILFACTCHVI